MRVLAYVVRRLLLLVPVVLGVSILTFLISHAMPGDPAVMAAGPHASPDVVAELRHKLGFDQPLYRQYIRYLSDLAHMKLGTSIQTGRQVADDILQRFPATLELTFFAMVVAAGIGIPLGTIAANNRNRWPDHLGRVIGLSGVAIPAFWMGLMLILVFYLNLRILPGAGRLNLMAIPPPKVTGLYTIDALVAGEMRTFWDALSHLVLPGVTQACAVVGMMTRMTRSSLLEVLQQDYIRVARAKGLKRGAVLYKHALKNGILPVVTLVGMTFGHTLGGSVLVESVFSWPGMGSYAVQAIKYMDFPAVMGVTVFIAITYALVNLAVDVAYFYIDPRIMKQ